MAKKRITSNKQQATSKPAPARPEPVEGPPIRILTFTPVWRRPEIFDICLQGIQRLCNYKPEKFEIIPFFVVSEAEAARQVLAAGFDFIFHQNHPLGEKKNAGLAAVMEKYEFDYLLEIGSDDLLINDFLDFMEPYFKKEIPQITPAEVWFIDIETATPGHWRTEKILGLGRCIHHNALQTTKKEGYQLWDPEKNRGMDTCSWLNLLRKGIKNYIVQPDKVYTLDIKSRVNINEITRFDPSPLTVLEILTHFPEGPQVYKLINREK